MRKLVILLILLLLVLFVRRWDKPPSFQQSYYVEHVVTAGESLWSIASEFDKRNTGRLVFMIQQENRITGAVVPGQVIRIPVPEVH